MGNLHKSILSVEIKGLCQYTVSPHVKCQNWAKLKKIQVIVKPPEVDDSGEEIDEDEPLYTIEQAPDPKYKFNFITSESYFQRKLLFQDNATKICEEFLPNHETRKRFMTKQPYDKTGGTHIFMSHSDMNTANKQTTETGMSHVEGGWPEHINYQIVEHRNNFIRRTCK